MNLEKTSTAVGAAVVIFVLAGVGARLWADVWQTFQQHRVISEMHISLVENRNADRAFREEIAERLKEYGTAINIQAGNIAANKRMIEENAAESK